MTAVAASPTALVQQAAVNVLRRKMIASQGIPNALTWSREHASIVHPTRGRIPFEPYPYQEAFLLDTAPRVLVLKARQIGFSQAFALKATHKALHYANRTILLVSRSQELAINLLGYCYNALYGLTDIPALTKENESEIGFANGSRIKSLPANRSTGRGFAASDVFLDEYAFQAYAEDIYRSVSPTVSHGGTLTVGSTPDGRGNHFYQLWTGMAGGEWSRHRVPWQDCPAYDAAWFQRERPNYTAQEWASEFGCDFITSGLAVFKEADIAACPDGWLGLQPPARGRQYVTGVDVGRRQDATVIVTFDITDGELQLVAYERLLGVPYPVIQQHIERRATAYGGLVAVESNGVGDPVIENLAVQVHPFVTTRKTKTDAITALALAHERRLLKHDIAQLRTECQLYQWQDEKLIQDSVMAAAIAVWCALNVETEVLYTHHDPVEISPY